LAGNKQHSRSTSDGLAWYEFDISWITLTMLKALGIAKQIRVAKIDEVLAEREAA
jgi:stearoyl-CoA desaturase (delta-9 desaturase)